MVRMYTFLLRYAIFNRFIFYTMYLTHTYIYKNTSLLYNYIFIVPIAIDQK